MRIVCDKCGAKYEVKDEKVRKKVFKIRCKRCSHEFVVRGTQAAQEQAAPEAAAVAEPQQATASPDDEATKVVDYSARQRELAEEEGAVWHVVINREQVGGLTAGDVLAYLGRGDVDPDTFTWREGMADWARLSTVPEFADAVAAATSQIGMEAEPDLGATAAIDLHAAGPIAGSPYAEEDVMVSNNVAEASGTAGGLFGGIDDIADPRITDPSQLRNQRNENSVLFSLDSLAEGAGAGPASPAAAATTTTTTTSTGGSEASGLIDMSLLDAGGSAPASTQSDMDALFGASSGPGAMPVGAGAPVQPLVQRKRSKIPMLLGIAAAVVLLIGGTAATMMYVLDMGDTEPAVAANTNTPVPPAKLSVGGTPKAKAAATAPEATKAATAAPTGDEGTQATKEAVAAATPTARPAKSTKTRTRGKRSRAAKPKRVVKTTGSSRLAGATASPKARTPKARPKRRSAKDDELDDLLGALDGKPAPRRTGPTVRSTGGGIDPADDPLLPERLKKQDILAVVRRNSGKISNCKAGTGVSGTITVRLTVAKSGRVSKSSVTSANFQGTPVGRCVEGKVKGFRFPAFRKGPMSFNLPFTL